MFGQYGFFAVFGGKDMEDPTGRDRYRNESKRLLGVLEQRFADGRQWIMGDQYTIADIAIFPWIRGAKLFYKAEEAYEMPTRPHTMAWVDRCIARPASENGLKTPAVE